MLLLDQPVYLLLSVAGAMILDRLFGEPSRLHPLVGFGVVAAKVESRLNRESHLLIRGVTAVTLLLLPTLLLIVWLMQWDVLSLALSIPLLYLAIGGNSLQQHGEDVLLALQSGDMAQARIRTGYLVSRETEQLNESELTTATVESLLENGNDAIFGALFWFLLLGAPGAVFYRLANTLDAMWGYRSEQYRRFGWAAAKLDDLLNYLPARLTGLSYALMGNFNRAIDCWHNQAASWKSSNAGVVMASGAGALSLQLGGPARYHGMVEPRQVLGAGDLPNRVDIERAIALLNRSQLLWLVALLLGVVLA